MSRSDIVQVASDLLQHGGPRAVTTRAVAAAAGVPAPTIFRLFGDKDGLMGAVAERAMEAYVAQEAASSAASSGDPLAALRSAWQTHIDFGLANPDLYGLLFATTRPEPSPAAAVGFQVLTARVRRLAEAGLLRVSVPRAVSMIHAAGTGVVLLLLAQPLAARDTGLSEASLEAVLDGILATRSVPPVTDLLALAVTLQQAVPRLPALSEAERTLLAEWLTRSVGELL